MNIGIDCRALQDSFIAGIGYYINYLLHNLAKIDNENRYILLYNSFRKSFLKGAPKYEYENFRQVMFRIPNVFFSGISGTPISALLPIERLMGGIDIFHATNYLLPYCSHARSILTIYDLSILKFSQFHPLKRRIVFSKGRLSNSAKACDAVIACSEATKTDIVDILNVRPEKIKVIYAAISPEFSKIDNKQLIDNVLKKYSLPEKYILYVGTLEPRKNVARLIEAFKKIKDRVKGEYRFVLIGGRGWHYKDIFATINRLRLDDSVVYLDYLTREDLPPILNGAEAFVYPSLYEGFGLPPLEAMACGVPTVVSKVSCFPEVVGDAALKVNPYSIDDIADGIYRILTDGGLRETLRQKGLERVKNYSWERTARETLTLYNEVYEGKYDEGGD